MSQLIMPWYCRSWSSRGGERGRMGSNKYNARKTIVDDITFASKREADRYRELKLMVSAKVIKDLELQPKYTLQPSFKSWGKTHKAIGYIADFRYIENNTGAVVVEDVKGMKTRVFSLKEKLFRYRFPDIDFRIVK